MWFVEGLIVCSTQDPGLPRFLFPSHVCDDSVSWYSLHMGAEPLSLTELIDYLR